MFCIKCGKTATVDNFCDDCFALKHDLFEVKPFNFFYCEVCGRKDDELKEEIIGRIKSQNRLDDIYVHLKIVGNKVHATVDCLGSIKGVKKREKKEVLVILRRKMCDMHVKLSGGYYEAMIQVRGEQKEEIMRRLRKLLPQKAVVGVEELKEGYNVKIMNKGTAASAARVLKNKYTVKASYKLVGSKKGQQLYRNFYAVR